MPVAPSAAISQRAVSRPPGVSTSTPPERSATPCAGQPSRSAAPAAIASSASHSSNRSRITIEASGSTERLRNQLEPKRLTSMVSTTPSDTSPIGSPSSASVRAGTPPPQAL